MSSKRWLRVLAASVALAAVVAPTAAFAEWKVQSEDGQTSLKFGFLAQMRAESFDTADGEDTSKDLYFRRARLLLGGKFGEKWSYFIETDSPNLGKTTDTGSKGSPDIFLQDWAVTYTHNDQFKLDAGLLLIPFAHNSLQSAASLLSVDYLPYSFLNSSPTDSRVGRDYGVLARGLIAKHFEYRAGVFSGYRGMDATNNFRYTARAAYHVFEPEAGLFYTGTTLGGKKILSIGAAIDKQEDYQATAFDVFWDQPIGEGNGLTVQVNLLQYDGDVFFTSLPKQDEIQGEAGFYFGGAHLMPFVAYAQRDYDNPSSIDEDQKQIGIAWYMAKFNRVLKLAWGQVSPDQGIDRDQIVLQLQAFYF